MRSVLGLGQTMEQTIAYNYVKCLARPFQRSYIGHLPLNQIGDK